jgi:hypothetical protein
MLVLALAAGAAMAQGRVASISFYGYAGWDPEAVRQALPFKPGDPYSRSRLAETRETVLRVTGHAPTEVASVCCVGKQDTAIFIGLNAAPIAWNDPPAGSTSLSREARNVYREMEQAEDAAFKRGSHEEDGAPGYRLSKDPQARAAELKVRDYAMLHEDELVRVLSESSTADERAVAADMLGYGKRSARQIAAFVTASLDPDGDVRNNATRALGEIWRAEPLLAAGADPGPYLKLIHSGIWTDRNKGVWALRAITASKNPAVLARVRAEALQELKEMSTWPVGWREDAQVILERLLLN